MDPSQWITQFKLVHERAKKGDLPENERTAYLGMREELARSLLAAQSMSVPDGQNARRHFRVAQLFQLELKNIYRTVTRELSRSGFSAVVTSEMRAGEKMSFTLTLARGVDPVTGEAKVVNVTKMAGGFRVSFAIDYLNDANAERLEIALFDAVLSRFK